MTFSLVSFDAELILLSEKVKTEGLALLSHDLQRVKVTTSVENPGKSHILKILLKKKVMVVES